MGNQESIEDYLMKICQKRYLHFDFPILKSEQKRLIDNISEEVKYHRYLPFIRTDIVFRKYSSGENKGIHNKVRRLTLPSHHDALVYQYFCYQLSKRYEERVENTSVDNSAVAYRSNKHISNINVAKEVVDFITNYGECWIIKGDFKSFFDTLDHNVLADNLYSLLGDEYNSSYKKMLFALTKYRYVTRKTLEKQLKCAGIKECYRRKNGRAYVKNLKQLGDLIKNNQIRFSSPNKKGIPQGTAVSAVLANIYMYKFDEWLAGIVEQRNGIYRRYSDDFIVVIPTSKENSESIYKLKKDIIGYCQNKICLTIESHKTKILFYSKDQKQIYRFDGDKYSPYSLIYLGFNFDGTSVSLKTGSIYKFVYRSKRSINRYISFINTRERYLKSKGPSHYVVKYTDSGVKAPRLANNTEMYRKRKFYKSAGNLDTNRVCTYHKNMVKRFLATKNIKPRSSMMSYAKKTQHIFEYQAHGKYRVVIYRQVMRQVLRNQDRLGKYLHK